MPYRRARWSTIALVPLVLVAFWPGYFSRLMQSEAILHAHAATASAWLALLIVQLWTIHRRRPALHRALGRALFALVPLFMASGALAVWNMAAKTTAGHPFYAVTGPGLGLEDIMSLALFALLVACAIAWRRRPPAHAAAMLASVLLVLPPATARLLPMILPLGASIAGFEIAMHAGQVLSAAGAIALFALDRRHGRPFLWVAVTCVVQSLAYLTIGRTAAWRAALLRLATLDPVAIAVVTTLATLALLWLTWRATSGARRTATVPA